MRSLTERANAVTALSMALANVRRRWRLRHLAVGAAIAIATLAVTMWGAAAVMERLRFSAESILWARIILGLVLAVVGVRWLLYPLVRNLPDDRLALYLEERVPSLDGAVISAVEVQQRPLPEEARSPLLERGLVADAVRRMERAVEVPRLERPATSRALGVTMLLMIGIATLFAIGPAYLRQGARLLLTPWRDPALAPVYSIHVEPGNATVAKGSDVQIHATLAGFSAELVEVVIRRGKEGDWERIPMGSQRDSLRFDARLFDVAEDAEYFVESSGVRSEVARLTVKNLPAVRTVSVELRFPAYTGLAPEKIEDGGDIAALAGTRATIRVRSTLAVTGGRLVLDDGTKIELTAADDTTLSTAIIVRRDGFYRVELDADDRTRVPGTMEYIVDALEDGAPQVTITKPGRDVRPTNVDEVFIEADAHDDFGVARMELVYRVNGGEEKVVALTDGSGQRPRDLTAGHTLFLEELGLQPGDVIAYYARVTDNGARGGQETSSDIYFLTVRPFGREYRQSQQGGGGGGGGGENPGALVARQKEIISATFKAQRDSAKTQKQTFREDVTTIHLSQGRLREQVKELIARLQRPGVQQADSGFRLLAEIMPKAMQEMQGAEEELVKGGVTAALGPEQRALQWLERAEAVFRDVQLSMEQQGGGGAGGQDANAEDLADLLELETDKLRNQYEQVQRGQQEQASTQTDEIAERLKRLAARQQQENERQRQAGQRQSGGGGGGSGSQRQLADETEQMARQLERLAREQRSAEMQESARQLQDAANEMRRSAAQSGAGGQGAAAAARDRLEEARRLLDESRQARNANGIEDAARRAQQLAEQQQDVARDVSQLGAAGAGTDRAERQRRIDERKQQMAGEVESLERDLDRMARELRARQPGAARSLQDAAGSIRECRVEDKIRYSRETIRSASPEYANNFERQIQEDLDQLRDRVSGISSTARAGNDSTQRAARTLDQARDLVRGLASIDERMRERENRRNAGGAQQGSQAGGQQGQDGKQSQGGQQGQSGQQGQDGKQGGGQQGQSGQQGQGGQDGKQGQGGQGQAGQQGEGGQGGQGQGGGRRGLQQGQGQQSGQPGAQGAMPQGRTPNGQMGGSGQGGPGAGLTAEDIRQFSRELRSQRDAAQELRQDLRGTGISTADLDRLIAQLREMESGRTFNDPEELERLRGSILEGMKEFEFGLRRQLGAAERAGPVLGGNDDVPQAYRDLVNEYFRALSRKPKQ